MSAPAKAEPSTGNAKPALPEPSEKTKSPMGKSGGKGSGRKPFKPTPRQVAPLSLQANQNPTKKTRDDPIFKEAVFAPTVEIIETTPIVRFHNNQPTLLRLTPLMIAEYRTENPKLGYVLTLEMLNYYATGLQWLRNIELRQSARLVLTQIEVEVQRLTQDYPFNIPEPIFLFLKGQGQIRTTAGQTLYPVTPPLPTQVVNNVGGLFGEVAENRPDPAILYTEYSTLGLTSEALQQSLLDHPNTAYVSVISLRNKRANANALGVSIVVKPQAEIVRNMTQIGVSGATFPESCPNTRFSLELMNAISLVVGHLKCFKLFTTTISKIETSGSLSQIVTCRPSLTNDYHSPIATQLAIETTSMSNDTKLSFGIARTFEYQMFKEPLVEDPPANEGRPLVLTPEQEQARAAELEAIRTTVARLRLQAQAMDMPLPDDLDNLGVENVRREFWANKNWIPLTYDANTPAPQAWVGARNQLRDLPHRYYNDVFNAGVSYPNTTRMLIVKSLASKV